MRIIARNTLRNFWEQYPDAEQALKAWFYEASRAQWQSPSEIKSLYRNASIIANNRVVFNIKGNNYRLVVHLKMLRGYSVFGFVKAERNRN
ncbi:MAG: type II toxin-antitoxin system HigB family toxin [Waterburya sp.]